MFSFKKPPARVIPNCNNCIYHRGNKCKLFKYTFPKINKVDELLINAAVCRKDHTMCGSVGMFFKEKNWLNWLIK